MNSTLTRVEEVRCKSERKPGTMDLPVWVANVSKMVSIHHWVVVSNIFNIFTPKIGEDEPILTSIFFKGVGSTTN